MKTFKVLLVDDDETSLLVTRSILEAAFPNVETEFSNNGEEAIEIFHKNPADIVLTDYHMDNFNGDQTARKLRESGSHIPIILITGTREVEMIEGLYSKGVDYVVKKPFSRNELIAKVSVFNKDVTTKQLENVLEGYANELGKDSAELIRNAFFQSTKSFINDFHHFFMKNDLGKLKKISHRYRSSASAVKSDNIIHLCERLENAEDINHCHRIFRQLGDHMERIMEKNLDPA